VASITNAIDLLLSSFPVHETIQPIIEKETIAPSVVHTTVPIHETHHSAPEHHGASILPTKSMAEFKHGGQSVAGSKGIINEDKYDGCPRPYNAEMQMGKTDADSNPHGHASGLGSQHGSTNAGDLNSNLMNNADPRVDSDRDGRGLASGMTGTSNANSQYTGESSGKVPNKNLDYAAAPDSHFTISKLTSKSLRRC
jgi:hypothetical protein